MAIIRAPRPTHHFTQIRNDVLRDDRLSYRARGILAVILSQPDDWGTSAEALARQGPEGRDAIRSALSELEDAGYLVRERRQDGRGRWTTQAVVYDAPQTDGQPALFQADEMAAKLSDSPTVTESQASVSQSSVSQAISTNTDLEHSPNGEAAPPVAPQQAIATAVYDHAQGMINFMAVRQCATRALKVKGATPEAVQGAMISLWDQGRPLTLTTVGQALAKRTGATQTNDEHWAHGGQF